VLTAEDTQNVIAALPPQQVIYFQASVDNQNRTLDASTGNNYTITFPLPLPAQAFWSLTLYNATEKGGMSQANEFPSSGAAVLATSSRLSTQ